MKVRAPKDFKILILALFVLFHLGGCVSVDLKPHAPTRSEVYQFVEPSLPFKKIPSEQADHVWQNSKNGNTLAILSECNEARDPSLANIENETILALTSPQIIRTEDIHFADRAGLRTLVEGQLDGVPVKMEILTFKKNSCAYTLSYIGKSKTFGQDPKAFQQLLEGFIVP